jgi:predicted methyltransferase
MLRRLGFVLAGVLVGCTPSTDAPAPSSPATDANGVHSDAAGAPAEAEARGSDEPAPAAVGAPVQVDGAVNDDYAKQTNPKRWAAQFEREGREAFDHRDEIIAALDLHEGMAVADVGAGTGLFTLALAQAVGPKGHVYAVDVQPYFLDHIGQKAKKAELHNVALVRARQDAVGLTEAAVDLVLMCDAYHHVEQPAAYLASLVAALRPGGRLVVIDYIAIEGQTKAWLLEHVRATPTVFRAEIESAGFRFVRAHEGLLKENFFFEFERP